MKNKIVFVTGISTEVGKTVASAVITEALHADYWKPIQAGELNFSDKDLVKSLVKNTVSNFFSIQFPLSQPMSPHAAAALDEVNVTANQLDFPVTEKTLVVEGAGGVLVPINDTETILDIIPKNAKIILVSRHYLGSINHTLLSIQCLQQCGFKVGLLFNGEENIATETIIQKMCDVTLIGRLDVLDDLNPETIYNQAQKIQQNLVAFVNE